MPDRENLPRGVVAAKALDMDVCPVVVDDENDDFGGGDVGFAGEGDGFGGGLGGVLCGGDGWGDGLGYDFGDGCCGEVPGV